MTKRPQKPRPRKPNATGRNGTPARFIKLEHYILNSPAFQSLKGNSVKLLLALWRRHNGSNNGQISYGAREGATIGLSKDQTARAFNELQDKGFLVCTKDASFGTNNRLAREWRLTMEKTETASATKDFMRIDKPRKPEAKNALSHWAQDAIESKT